MVGNQKHVGIHSGQLDLGNTLDVAGKQQGSPIDLDPNHNRAIVVGRIATAGSEDLQKEGTDRGRRPGSDGRRRRIEVTEEIGPRLHRGEIRIPDVIHLHVARQRGDPADVVLVAVGEDQQIDMADSMTSQRSAICHRLGPGVDSNNLSTG